ncbi:hypothetical protein WJ978_06045 [Achromobacter xylosoxidans]
MPTESTVRVARSRMLLGTQGERKGGQESMMFGMGLGLVARQTAEISAKSRR